MPAHRERTASQVAAAGSSLPGNSVTSPCVMLWGGKRCPGLPTLVHPSTAAGQTVTPGKSTHWLVTSHPWWRWMGAAPPEVAGRRSTSLHTDTKSSIRTRSGNSQRKRSESHAWAPTRAPRQRSHAEKTAVPA